MNDKKKDQPNQSLDNQDDNPPLSSESECDPLPLHVGDKLPGTVMEYDPDKEEVWAGIWKS